jgi:hypothetical protein
MNFDWELSMEYYVRLAGELNANGNWRRLKERIAKSRMENLSQIILKDIKI